MAAQSSRKPPSGWVRRTQKKQDGTQVKFYVNMKTKTTVYLPEDMFRYLNGETGPENPREPRVASSKSTVVSPHGIIFELPKSPTVERHQEPA